MDGRVGAIKQSLMSNDMGNKVTDGITSLYITLYSYELNKERKAFAIRKPLVKKPLRPNHLGEKSNVFPPSPQVSVLSYSAKFASCYYGPFR